MQRAQELNALWHSVLPITDLSNLVRNPKYVAYWADFDDRAYATAIWTTPSAANRLADGYRLLELKRLAIADDAPRNTASRMLRIMRKLVTRKFPDIIRLISYQAEQYHQGTIYSASGWRASARSESSPWHVGEQSDNRQMRSATIRWECNV